MMWEAAGTEPRNNEVFKFHCSFKTSLASENLCCKPPFLILQLAMEEETTISLSIPIHFAQISFFACYMLQCI